jgi:hypothetical protein
MEQKDKMFWFRALEEKREIQKKICKQIILNIGELLFVKQTPITDSQPAIIKKVDNTNNKVLVYWIFSDCEEIIELYEPLFERKERRR